jgi:L-iditol 2-dehydrogenase
MSTAKQDISVDAALTARNIGVYTDPEHNLYVADAKPTLEDVLDGASLQAGEVTVAIKCSGICG